MEFYNRIKEIEGTIKNDGNYVLYWMQQSQRVVYNHSLSLAIELANSMSKPLVVAFGLTDGYPGANLRHYYFMLEGLRDVACSINKLNVSFVVLKGSPDDVCISLSKESCAVVMDMGYTRIQRLWRENVKSYLGEIGRKGYLVESDVAVPVEIASQKEELAARTIRNKIFKVMDDYLSEPIIEKVHNGMSESKLKAVISKSDYEAIYINNADEQSANNESIPFDVDHIVEILNIDKSVDKSLFYKGGEVEAQRTLEEFLENRFDKYELRNHPEFNYSSDLSPYLHFGQISTVDIVNRCRKRYLNLHLKSIKEKSGGELDFNKAYSHDGEETLIPKEAYRTFIDELVIRRELAINFVYYNENYDRFEGMTYPWAYETMKLHENDEYKYEYDLDTIEYSKTHDPYFNSAMDEMRITGKMHTYMRMYWAKKIIEWVKPHKEAYKMTIYLNDKYFIDGRDPNSYTGVAWCYGKHDHGWSERDIFGKLRYMNSKGLERKFDIKGYVKRVEEMKSTYERESL